MLKDAFTSTGAKFFAHQEAMRKLQNGQGQPIVTHVMLTDVCNHSCAFCSVQARAGDSLPFEDVMNYLDILRRFGLKAVILSGGGNPILYKNEWHDFNDVVEAIHSMGLEIGLITNGMPLTKYEWLHEGAGLTYRESWKIIRPETLDKLTWVRISMAGLDHVENEVYVPDIDPSKTTLGFSYVGHDIYVEPADPHHGKVSTRADLLSGDKAPERPFESRIDELIDSITHYARVYQPKYVRLLPNCLEPELISRRCEQLEAMASVINSRLHETYLATEEPSILALKSDYAPVFVQHKPPKAPHACYLGYIHPVLNCDGYVYPCDSCVLNEAAGHQFANPWRICHWKDIASIYEKPVRSLIADPGTLCPGCVFTQSNEQLRGVVEGGSFSPPEVTPEHVNFV